MNVLDMLKLDGKHAIVTGGTKGLGRAIAEGLAEAGATVTVISRHGEEASSVAAELTKSTGQNCTGYACDVTEPDQVSELVNRVLANQGQIDVLINNAGINIRGPIDELEVEEFQSVQNINVTGPWLMCKAIAPHMKERGSGSVINIGSTLSVIGMADRTPYCTSKGAILQMTRALAMEWAPYNITVNAMLPGPFATEMNLPITEDPEAFEAFMSKIPLGRWGEVDEIKGLAVFLASDAARFITGAGIAIDGGWTTY